MSDNISPQHKNPMQIYYTVFVLYLEALCERGKAQICKHSAILVFARDH